MIVLYTSPPSVVCYSCFSQIRATQPVKCWAPQPTQTWKTLGTPTVTLLAPQPVKLSAPEPVKLWAPQPWDSSHLNQWNSGNEFQIRLFLKLRSEPSKNIVQHKNSSCCFSQIWAPQPSDARHPSAWNSGHPSPWSSGHPNRDILGTPTRAPLGNLWLYTPRIPNDLIRIFLRLSCEYTVVSQDLWKL